MQISKYNYRKRNYMNTTEIGIGGNREHKDTLFRKIFVQKNINLIYYLYIMPSIIQNIRT